MSKRIVNTQIVHDFMQLNKQIGDILTAYGISHAYIYDKVLNMSRLTWYKRIRKGNFSAEELLKICNSMNRE